MHLPTSDILKLYVVSFLMQTVAYEIYEIISHPHKAIFSMTKIKPKNSKNKGEEQGTKTRMRGRHKERKRR